MTRKQSKGTCELCKSSFSKNGMTKHLKTCILKNIGSKGKQNRKRKFFHIVVMGYYEPDYWMHLAVPAKAKLQTLDQFFRDIWLECCGHLSAFEINGKRYSVSPMEEYGERGMSKKIGDILEPGIVFHHEYDFGSTTELGLKVISEFEANIKDMSIKILSRNDAPEIRCDKCGKMATQVCTQCIYEGLGWLCDDCAEDHECGEEMMLPVVNSPRVGVCGYCG